MEGKGNTILLTVIGIATLMVALVGATFAYFTAQFSNDTAQSISVTTGEAPGLTYMGSNLELLNAMPGDYIGFEEELVGDEMVLKFDSDGKPILNRDEEKDQYKFTVYNLSETMTQSYDLDLVINNNEFTYTDCSASFVTSSKDSGACNVDAPQLNVYMQAFSDKGTTLQLANKTVYDLTDGVNASKKGNSINIVSDQLIAPGETQTFEIGLIFEELGYPQDNNEKVNFYAFVQLSDVVGK